MEITVREAADALSVSREFISRRYLGAGSTQCRLPDYRGIESEELCAILQFDHRFLLAFLTQYDACLRMPEVVALLNRDYRTIMKRVPVLFRVPRIVRFSHRVVLGFMEGLHDKSHPIGKLGPTPDRMDAQSFRYVSAISTQGKRLPRTMHAKLPEGHNSILPRMADD